MYADSEFTKYKSGVFNCSVNNTDATNYINHAVLLIGYDESGNYIIKNSWDTTWGENGFATINKNADCGIWHRPFEIRGINEPIF